MVQRLLWDPDHQWVLSFHLLQDYLYYQKCPEYQARQDPRVPHFVQVNHFDLVNLVVPVALDLQQSLIQRKFQTNLPILNFMIRIHNGPRP